MATIQLPPHSKEFLRLLTSHRVEYLLVGGYAVGYYGYPRATVDIDIWIERSEANADKAVAVLEEFGFENAGSQRKWLLEQDKVVRMGREPNRIELLTGIDGVDFLDCSSRGIEAQIDGISVRIIALEDLKANKKASGRYKDLNDLEHLP
ncbi:MAG: nucleotidyltransferase [Candidatus Hydrogenedentes bacterium]|nr:nucleotidyltransferase [Candidatus Hydrogenedentota bacterium]